MKNISKYFWAIVDYAPSILTLAFGLYVALEVNRRTVNTDTVLNWVLTLLVFMATTQLIEKLRDIKAVKDNVEKLIHLFRSSTSHLKTHSERVEFEKMSKDASMIDIIAWTGIDFYNRHEGFIEQKIVNGCKIRLLIVNDQSNAANVIMENSRNKELIADIQRMKLRYEKFCNEYPIHSKNFELRLTNWVTPLGMIITNRNKSDGAVSIKLHAVYLPTHSAKDRYFHIDSHSNNDDFQYFVAQFESLWNIAAEYSVSQIAHKENSVMN